MGVNSLPSAWRTNLRTGAIQDREYRMYLDPRGVEYPDLETGDAAYTVAREDNLIDRGNCESAIAPMIFGETVPLTSNATFARSSDFAHGGDYSYKFTKTVAAGTSGFVYTVDATGATDMHGMVSGSAYEFSAWVYIPTASGIDPSEVAISMIESNGGAFGDVTSQVVATGLDAWEQLTIKGTFADDTTGAALRFRALATAANNEYFYVDDIRLTSHSIPGSHYLSSGYIETLCPMTETFTLQFKLKPNFAYDTGTTQQLLAWRIDATHEFQIFYNTATDQFRVLWEDGGVQRNLYSAQYDDGSAQRNINQWLTLTVAIDLSTGDTSGSSLWMDKTQDDTAWDGNIDALSTEFNKLVLRGLGAGFVGDYDIAYVRLFPNLVATDAQVQNDFEEVYNEEIFWSLDGHGTGKTRCNVTPFFNRYDTYKGVTSKVSASHGTNLFNFTLKNLQGEFSDDQYAAFTPASFQYNGTDTDGQRYLTRRMNVGFESWYGGDFEHLFVGRLTEAGLRRSSLNPQISYVEGSAEDGVGDIDRTIESDGRKYSDHALVRGSLIDRGNCESTTPPMVRGEITPLTSDGDFDRTSDEVYSGRYSYKFTKTIAAGTPGYVWLTDNNTSTDMHEFEVDKTYTVRVKMHAPAAGFLGTEFVVYLSDYVAGWGNTTQAGVATADVWQNVEVTRTIRSAATGVRIILYADQAAAVNEYVYVDAIEVIPSDISEAHDISLFHEVAHLADRNNVQYLANNSFENATIGNSWLVTGGGLTKDAADGLFGSASGEMIPGAGNETMYQDVTFTGNTKLNVGETYTFYIWLKSTVAASGAQNSIYIAERDGTPAQYDTTTQLYILAGGEGYKKIEVSHTITDSRSDRIRVHVKADAGDTINIDGAMLAPANSALNYFSENTNDGVAGVESADDAAAISWPWFGIDAAGVDVLHPWRRVEAETTIWENLKSLANACGSKYCGMSEANTLTLKAVLQTEYSDDVPIDEWTAPRQSIGVTLDALAANKIVGHGVRIVKSDNLRLIWLASATGNFADPDGDNQLSETVADDGTWPDQDDYPEYWAQYGTSGDRRLRRYPYITLFPTNRTTNGEFSELNPSHGGFISPVPNMTANDFWQEQFNTAYVPVTTSKRDNIVGLQNADLFSKAVATGDGAGAWTETTFDVDLKAGQAKILLTNETGAEDTLVECAILGQPVYQFEGDEGYTNDGFVDRVDIMENGERLLEFGGGDVVEVGQLDRLADFLWKDRGQRKHVYALSFAGTTHDVSPSDIYLLAIGDSGETEYILSRAEVMSVRIEQRAGSLGVTQVILRELEEAWKYDSNVVSRFNARGVLVQSPSTGSVVTVGSEYSTINTDYRIDIGDTSAERPYFTFVVPIDYLAKYECIIQPA